jgi:photosystem II stability/assembly factor-like uncharacterized protein
MKKRLDLCIVLLTLFLLTACAGDDSTDIGKSVDNFSHVHGLSFNPKEPYDLYLGTHHGLIQIDSKGHWSYVSEDKHRHDLLSFTFRDEDTMISSGHPAEASNMQDPLGVIISKDLGKTWEAIALHGEVDFHVLEVNASDPNVIYGIDAHGTGFYRSTDGGNHWEVLEANGFTEEYPEFFFTLVSDPGNAQSLLAGTQQGIFSSQDGGETWELISTDQTLLSGVGVSDRPGTIVAYADGEPSGLIISNDFGESWRSLNMQLDDDDEVLHIAIHPTDEDTYAIGTLQEHLFQTTDGGEAWVQLAEFGKPRSSS